MTEKMHAVSKKGLEASVKDVVSGYITKDVDDLENYTTTVEETELIAEKADVADIPAHGQVAAGNTGYIKGKEAYAILGTL